ncbi:uncharacterized protein LOC101858694 [Aplysia californica]|uniref:Uncharacterized protein LOC101858694 n=1 Tax=Aplysia californica TaxID=6500 RepID=A0ABM0ZUG7_APLCA|nr:uncharacterized protein LOC101858694 [Aplysia californica]
MAAKISLYTPFQILLTALLTYGYPSSTSLSASSMSSSSSSSSLEFNQERSSQGGCQSITVPQCSAVYSLTQLPNVYGHYTQDDADKAMTSYLVGKIADNNGLVNTFLCVLYLPPCSEDIKVSSSGKDFPLPCRSMCETALAESPDDGGHWPVGCHMLPTENCYSYDGIGGVTFLKQSLKATPTYPSHQDDIASFAPLDIELGNDDGYEVEVVSLTSNQIPVRRYDIADLGDPEYFRGWADVQGKGSANDYCRVIGKGRRRFLSCNLAGSTGQGHHYVSKLGFEAGFNNTWYMRDMDGDGRDDYCRCTGSQKHNNNRVTCMKAGEKGFYGSTTQGGSQYTYSLPGSVGCHNRVVNPNFGE